MAESRKLHVFLCHASQDKPVVRELYQRFLAEGWIDPWLDEEKLLPGQDWDMEIEKALRAIDAVIVCLSTNSVDKEGYIQHEIRLVLRAASYKPDNTIFLIPIRLNDCAIPMRMELQHYVDFFPSAREEWAYQRLSQALQSRLGQIIKRESDEQDRKVSEEKMLIEASERAVSVEEKARKKLAEKGRLKQETRERIATEGKVRKEKALKKETDEEKTNRDAKKKIPREPEERVRGEVEQHKMIQSGNSVQIEINENADKATPLPNKMNLLFHILAFIWGITLLPSSIFFAIPPILPFVTITATNFPFWTDLSALGVTALGYGFFLLSIVQGIFAFWLAANLGMKEYKLSGNKIVYFTVVISQILNVLNIILLITVHFVLLLSFFL